jgi:ribose 5-phosphate isomerase RpiB
MKTPRIYIGALAVFCIAALVIGSAGAAVMTQTWTGNNFKDTGGKGPMHGEANGERMSQLLDNLTAKGYDVSAIGAAVTGGDYKTAVTLLKEFMTANPDARPARGDGTGSGPMGGQWRAQNN